jgi:hypothetical protein
VSYGRRLAGDAGDSWRKWPDEPTRAVLKYGYVRGFEIDDDRPDPLQLPETGDGGPTRRFAGRELAVLVVVLVCATAGVYAWTVTLPLPVFFATAVGWGLLVEAIARWADA